MFARSPRYPHFETTHLELWKNHGHWPFRPQSDSQMAAEPSPPAGLRQPGMTTQWRHLGIVCRGVSWWQLFDDNSLWQLFVTTLDILYILLHGSLSVGFLSNRFWLSELYIYIILRTIYKMLRNYVQNPQLYIKITIHFSDPNPSQSTLSQCVIFWCALHFEVAI